MVGTAKFSGCFESGYSRENISKLGRKIAIQIGDRHCVQNNFEILGRSALCHFPESLSGRTILDNFTKHTCTYLCVGQ